MKNFQVIFPEKINVCCKPRQPEEVFEADPKEQEIKCLVAAKYIKEV